MQVLWGKNVAVAIEIAANWCRKVGADDLSKIWIKSRYCPMYQGLAH